MGVLRDPSRNQITFDSDIDLSEDAHYLAIFPAIHLMFKQLEASGFTAKSVEISKDDADKYTYSLTVSSTFDGSISRASTSWIAYCIHCKHMWEGPGYLRSLTHPNTECTHNLVEYIMES